jgi:hypothetical protein
VSSPDDLIRQAVDRAVAPLRTPLEAELRAFAEEVRRQAERQIAIVRETAQRHAEDLRKTTEAQVNELTHALEDARRESDQRVAQARRDHESDLERIRREAAAELDRARAEFQRDVEKARQAATLEAEELVVAQLENAALDAERKLTAAVERATTDSHQAALAHAARFVDAIRTLDDARSLSEVLETLADCAGREVDRAAILIVKGDRLKGWRMVGFGPGAPAAKSIDIPLDERNLPGVQPLFSQDAVVRHALSLPISVGGAVVAVLYGDTPRGDSPSDLRPSTGARGLLSEVGGRWPAMLDVLARHASRVLEAMTVQQAAGLALPRPVARASHASMPGPLEQSGTGVEEDARRYARLLLSEIRMYNEPLVEAGRRSRDLLSRLGGEIERARQLYEARIPETVSARSIYFEQELVRTLADGDRSLLGSVQ